MASTSYERCPINQMGKAIIIGINKFADPNEKMIETNGDRKDIGDFEKMALSWGWECIKLLNEHCSTADLQTKLRDLANDDNNRTIGSLIVVFIGHGQTKGRLYTHDGTINVNDVLEIFTGSISLAKIPKLFFIQACRGLKYDKAPKTNKRRKPRTLFRPECDDLSVVFSTKEGVPLKHPAAGSNKRIAIPAQKFVMPKCDDLFVLFSTKEGFASFKHPDDGSSLIQSLLRKMESEETRNLDLVSMLTDVKYELRETPIEAKVDEDELTQAFKQVSVIQKPYFHSFFFKRYYLPCSVRFTSTAIETNGLADPPFVIKIEQDDKLPIVSTECQPKELTCHEMDERTPEVVAETSSAHKKLDNVVAAPQTSVEPPAPGSDPTKWFLLHSTDFTYPLDDNARYSTKANNERNGAREIVKIRYEYFAESDIKPVKVDGGMLCVFPRKAGDRVVLKDGSKWIYMGTSVTRPGRKIAKF